MLGIHLQASSIISMPFAIITTIIWFYTEPILILLHQDTDISKMAALNIRFLILGLFAYGFLQNILKFLQAQSNCVAPGHSQKTTIGYSCWNCICTGHLPVLWEHQWQLQFHYCQFLHPLKHNWINLGIQPSCYLVKLIKSRLTQSNNHIK